MRQVKGSVCLPAVVGHLFHIIRWHVFQTHSWSSQRPPVSPRGCGPAGSSPRPKTGPRWETFWVSRRKGCKSGNVEQRLGNTSVDALPGWITTDGRMKSGTPLRVAFQHVRAIVYDRKLWKPFLISFPYVMFILFFLKARVQLYLRKYTSAIQQVPLGIQHVPCLENICIGGLSLSKLPPSLVL